MNRKTFPSRTILVLAVFLASAVAGFAQPPVAPPRAGEVLVLEERRFAAMVNRDIPTLRELLADDLTYTHSSGQLETKEQLLESIASGSFQYLAIQPQGSFRVRMYGDTAVITGQGTFRVRAGGEERSLRLRYTDIYAFQDGRWQMVAWHSTRLPD